MKTPKLLLVAAISLFISFILSNPLLAQQDNRQQSLKVGVGYYSTERVRGSLEDKNTYYYITMGGTFRRSVVNRSFSPTYSLSYSFPLSENLSLAFGGALEKSSGDLQEGTEIVGYFRKRAYTLAAEGTYVYLRKENLTIYGLLGLGYTLLQQESERPEDWGSLDRNHFNSQISPIGLRKGNKLGITVEIGYGYKGIINSGIDFHF